MATNFKVSYPGSSAVTITLASLSGSSTWTAGEQSNEVDNTTNLDDDLLVSLKVKMGTSPTAGTQVNLYAVAIDTQAAAYPDVITGAGDAGKTWTSQNVLNAGAVLLKSMLVDSTTGRTYYATGISVAAAFGGVLPPKLVFFVAHNTGAALDSTGGNHALNITRVQFQGV